MKYKVGSGSNKLIFNDRSQILTVKQKGFIGTRTYKLRSHEVSELAVGFYTSRLRMALQGVIVTFLHKGAPKTVAFPVGGRKSYQRAIGTVRTIGTGLGLREHDVNLLPGSFLFGFMAGYSAAAQGANQSGLDLYLAREAPHVPASEEPLGIEESPSPGHNTRVPPPPSEVPAPPSEVPPPPSEVPLSPGEEAIRRMSRGVKNVASEVAEDAQQQLGRIGRGISWILGAILFIGVLSSNPVLAFVLLGLAIWLYRRRDER